MSQETLIIVKSFAFAGPSRTIVVTIPKRFGEKQGQYYSVIKDQKGRLLYTPIIAEEAGTKP